MSEVLALLARVGAAKHERQKANAAIQKDFAPDFNPVELLAPGETRLSEVLRWLLDEHETHGQGPLFRDHFITDIVGENSQDWVGASVACEVLTADRRGRIDVLLKSADGQKRIAIENKPWAGWQEAQLSRYWEDQSKLAPDVRVLALIGAHDAADEMRRHWPECNGNGQVAAHSFETVAAWLEDCAKSVRPDHVRRFLFDTADYCRRYVMNEANPAKGSETAELLISGGSDLLKAAVDVAEALPRALTLQVAHTTGGSYHQVGNFHAVQIHHGGVPLSFVLFGVSAAWAGVTDSAVVGELSSEVAWGSPDKRWLGWAWVKNLGEHGVKLAHAAVTNDFEGAARLLPEVAQVMLKAKKPNEPAPPNPPAASF